MTKREVLIDKKRIPYRMCVGVEFMAKGYRPEQYAKNEGLSYLGISREVFIDGKAETFREDCHFLEIKNAYPYSNPVQGQTTSRAEPICL